MRIRSGEQLIGEVRKIAGEAIAFSEESLNNLTHEQLQFKPNSSAWNISQILAHLNSYSKYYNKVFRVKIRKSKYDLPKEKYIGSPLGLATIKSMKLGKANNVRRKLKSPKMHNPSIHPELLEGDQVLIFLKNQKEMLEIANSAATINLMRTKIPLAISKRIKLRLGDALLFVSFHVERHLQQINNIKLDSKYPA